MQQILEMYEKNGSAKLTTIRQYIGGNQRLQLTVAPDVWYSAFPTRDYNVSMVDWDYFSVVKNALRDADKCFLLVGTTVAPSFEWRKDAGDEGGAMNGRTIDCDCDIFVVVGGSVLEELGSGTRNICRDMLKEKVNKSVFKQNNSNVARTCL